MTRLNRDVRSTLDGVAKLKNEMTAKFRLAPAEADIWQSSAF